MILTARTIGSTVAISCWGRSWNIARISWELRRVNPLSSHFWVRISTTIGFQLVHVTGMITASILHCTTWKNILPSWRTANFGFHGRQEFTWAKIGTQPFPGWSATPFWKWNTAVSSCGSRWHTSITSQSERAFRERGWFVTGPLNVEPQRCCWVTSMMFPAQKFIVPWASPWDLSLIVGKRSVRRKINGATLIMDLLECRAKAG